MKGKLIYLSSIFIHARLSNTTESKYTSNFVILYRGVTETHIRKNN